MGESFSQRRRNVEAALRRVRTQYRKADTAGELVERELDRLILRKTIISPESMQGLLKKVNDYARALNALEAPLSDALRLSQSYV